MSSYLLWWTFHFLQVLLHHLLWSFTCRQKKIDLLKKQRHFKGRHHQITHLTLAEHSVHLELSPLRACFLVVFLQQWPKPGTGLMSLLLTGGGCSTSLGGLVRHTGRAAALIRIPVIPETQQRGVESGWFGRFLVKFPQSNETHFQLSAGVRSYRQVQGEQGWIH